MHTILPIKGLSSRYNFVKVILLVVLFAVCIRVFEHSSYFYLSILFVCEMSYHALRPSLNCMLQADLTCSQHSCLGLLMAWIEVGKHQEQFSLGSTWISLCTPFNNVLDCLAPLPTHTTHTYPNVPSNLGPALALGHTYNPFTMG